MHTRCPACGAGASLDALVGHEAAREALVKAFGLSGALGRALLQYLALFRPAKRELSMSRIATLLGEILPDIERGRVTRHSREWPAPASVWIEAINITIQAPNLRRPLDGHGYLYGVIVNRAESLEAAAETKREQERAYPYSSTRQASAAPRMLGALAGQAAGDGRPYDPIVGPPERKKSPPPPEVVAAFQKFKTPKGE
ncbi:MAG: hypothetical protein FWD77_08355 [Betaproteobacteria bacterium]|nr:hypothetical protein [Betaproteobacteria bacterium]